jgi:tRNA-2-methylthio-N6-dimethylallyladenosine synthase
MKYYIITFGCAANEADSERIAAAYESRGFTKARTYKEADEVVVNTCMIRQMAEDRVYGIINNIQKFRSLAHPIKIVLTGCMVGMAVRDASGKLQKILKNRMPAVDVFLPIEEVGFDNTPLRSNRKHALVPISNGCNNFCTYCVVPFARGREVSRPFEDIISECKLLAKQGYFYITLVGQNVNSYGSDIAKKYHTDIKKLKITYVKHLGRLRIPTLFPALLNKICTIKAIQKIDFISSNPWDFSDELIRVIAENPKISRQIHLPVQSGDSTMLKKMNRWYTRAQYIARINKIRKVIPDVMISTDIIVGFCGETKKQFENTVSLARKIGFSKAYISMYSDRPMTAAHKTFTDNVTYKEKKRRWEILDELINKTNLRNGTYQ